MSGARWDAPDERRSFVWQSSHIGAPMSELAEMEARAAGADGEQLAEARQAEDADGSGGGGQARLEAREGQEGERPAGQPPQAGNPVAATRFIPLLPLSQTIPADEEQYGMLIEQLMDPLNGGPQWPYYFRRSYGTPSDGLVWEAGNDITELVIFRATPHVSFPPTNYHSFPPFDYQGAGSGNGDATHIIERDHHGDGKNLIAHRMGPCLQCRQRIRCRRCSFCNEYTFCSDACNRLGYRHFHKSACRAITARRVAMRATYTVELATGQVSIVNVYDQHGVRMRYGLNSSGRPANDGERWNFHPTLFRASPANA